MEKIILLQDYRSSFGSKFNASPACTGLNLKDFISEMNRFGYRIVPTYFFDIDFRNPQSYTSKKIIYKSSEANDGFGEYKSQIDDVIYFLKLAGAQLIPDYKYFKAHSNKSFMEMLRGFMNDENIPETRFYGSLQDFNLDSRSTRFPVVIKKSHGAQATGVFKASNKKELLKVVSRVSKASFTLKELLKEKLRKIKYGTTYIPFSIHRNKFIIQSFTPGLSGDYKVLVFNDFSYLVKRENRPNDFRASGGGYNTFTGEFELPQGLLDYAYGLFEKFNCPYISLDIGINENGFNLIEFQFVDFGSLAHYKSKFYFKRVDGKYLKIENNLSLEYLYSYSLNAFLNK